MLGGGVLRDSGHRAGVSTLLPLRLLGSWRPLAPESALQALLSHWTELFWPLIWVSFKTLERHVQPRHFSKRL